MNGTVGSGKTSVAAEIGVLFEFSDVPHAVIDLDELRRGWPAPEGDPFNRALERANLASVTTNYAASGAQVLVVAGVLETRDDLDAYRGILGRDLWVVRLDTPADDVARRLRVRHAASTADRDWYLARATELAKILQDADLDHLVVATGGRTVVEVATDIVARFSNPL